MRPRWFHKQLKRPGKIILVCLKPASSLYPQHSYLFFCIALSVKAMLYKGLHWSLHSRILWRTGPTIPHMLYNSASCPSSSRACRSWFAASTGMLCLIRRHRNSLSRRRRHVSSQLPMYVAASVEMHRRILRQAYRRPATSIAAFYGKCEFGLSVHCCFTQQR